MTKSELLDRIRCLLGGRAAEELIFGEVSTGAQNDLERATTLARQMVAMYGMNDRIGLVSCIQRQSAFLSGPDSPLQRDCSEQTAREIDEEVKHILEEAYSEAKTILIEHRGQLEKVTTVLLEKETIDGSEFYSIVGREKPKEKEPVPSLTNIATATETKESEKLNKQNGKLSKPMV